MERHRVYTILQRQGLYGGFSLFYWAGLLYAVIISTISSSYWYLLVGLIFFTHVILGLLKKEDREIYRILLRYCIYFSLKNTRLTGRCGWNQHR